MSENYDKVKRYYDAGLWSLAQIRRAVNKWITPEEYQNITGEVYI